MHKWEERCLRTLIMNRACHFVKVSCKPGWVPTDGTRCDSSQAWDLDITW